MFEKDGVSRRSFVKQSLVATGVAGGVLGNVQTVAADKPQTLTVDGNGKYEVVVNDPNATGRNLEDDRINDFDRKTKINGNVEGDKDIIDFDGWITRISLEGDIVADVYGSDDTPGGDVVVSGDEGGSQYAFTVSNSVEATADCEDESIYGGDTVNGTLNDYGDDDTFEVIGTITTASTFSFEEEVTFKYVD
ncbi:hypothetical protein C440_00760 [Haloferax mucosum ATCC BAA-1512]|uniref:Twin-arginine translocation signal domain-containing protein n=1 Tax=Haloferax mucosum ATCC BAA-1512 TaxID=662479 RepID=M0IS25_9EURY|nr:twin-arginine translocation signal domain-containing protein [Haloferax mucosum]ELZ98842.1 hypothetical protein C440_00760 [Haloferax mucosum ATCC BAA-1512]